VKKPVQIFEKSVHAYSQVYSSRERAKYFIGRPDGAIGLLFAVSEREMNEIMTNLPEELLEAAKKHYGLVSISDVSKSIEETFETENVLVHPSGEVAIELTEQEDLEEVDIYKMNIKQLRQVASQLEIKGYTKYDKEELLKKIEEVADSE
jgi:glycine cleavage system protein P-like pyridoxal-binding family